MTCKHETVITFSVTGEGDRDSSYPAPELPVHTNTNDLRFLGGIDLLLCLECGLVHVDKGQLEQFHARGNDT